MSKHEDSWGRLDTEFDHYLLDMKPFVLKHPNRTGEMPFNLSTSLVQQTSLQALLCVFWRHPKYIGYCQKVTDETAWMYVAIYHFPLSFLFMSERQQCAIWIKKLCDPATCGSGLIGRKNRNMYARLLLHMLKRGVLELPFTCKPGPGSLKTLPTYMVRMP